MKWLESYLADESFAILEKKRILFSIKIITLISVVLFSVLIITRLLFLPDTNLADYLLWFMTGIVIIVNVFARKGKIPLAGSFFVITIWIILTIMACKYEGVRDIALTGYIVCILIAFNITLYGQSHVVFFLSLISVWAMVYAETNHILTPKIDSTLNYGIEYTIVLVFVMTLLILNRKNQLFYQKSLQKEFKEKISAERSLRESESLIKSISNNLSGGMIYQLMLKADGIRKFTYLSDSVKRLYGITPEEGMADASMIYRRIHEDDIESITKAEDEAAKALSVFRLEVRINNPSGETRWASVVSTPRKMDDGTICFDGIEFDITEIKKGVTTLNESKERFRTLSSITTEGLMIHKDGIIIDTNQAFVKILGFSSPDDIIGKNGIESIQFTPESKKVVIDHFISNSEATFEVELINLNGDIIPVETKGIAIEYMGMESRLVYMRDISDRKKAERELEKYQNHLEILVKERTEELDAANEELNVSNKVLYEQREELQASLSRLQETQIKLVQAEKMASLGVLAAGVAHEINNPLNFIQGGAIYIETYLKDNLPEIYEEVKPVIEGINTGVKRAAIIVRSLNQYSRSDDLSYSNCNLHDIIEDCLMILNNQLKNRVEVQKQYTEEQYILEGNEGKLHQVFLNILSNASQAIKDNGKITILTKLVKDDIHISITDNGHGISRENSKKVFDPFFTTKEPGKGTGLGLSITYNIIQEHNGTIELKSQVGVGTKVTIKLPAKTK